MSETRLQVTVIVSFMLASLILLIVVDMTGPIAELVKSLACSVMATVMAITLLWLARKKR